MAQEAALLAERSDVTEELDRLGAHLEQVVDDFLTLYGVGSVDAG